MKTQFLPIAALAMLATATSAHAEWLIDNGVAIVAPTSNNSTMELLVVSCGDPYSVEIYSRGGPVRPDSGDAAMEADYFYQPGKVQARIDGQSFALTAAGSDAAVVLFAQGTAAQQYMAPIAPAFINALKTGSALTLAFDVTPERNATDGSPFETTAEFPLTGSTAVLETALATCS